MKRKKYDCILRLHYYAQGSGFPTEVRIGRAGVPPEKKTDTADNFSRSGSDCPHKSEDAGYGAASWFWHRYKAPGHRKHRGEAGLQKDSVRSKAHL